MEIIIQPNKEAVTSLASRIIVDRLITKPNLVLGCATGRTMNMVYESLIALAKEQALSFSEVCTFNLDEYVGLDAKHPQSYAFYMQEKLFSRTDILAEHTQLLNGTASNLKGECDTYETKITDYGGIDVQLLGIGQSGHIGFNEPLSSLGSRTREKALTETTRLQNQAFFETLDAVPKRALTMGVGTILESKEILLLATGKHKAEIISKAAEGPITGMISATSLQFHRSCKIIVDEDAASELREKEYYRWVFDNEPEWEKFR